MVQSLSNGEEKYVQQALLCIKYLLIRCIVFIKGLSKFLFNYISLLIIFLRTIFLCVCVTFLFFFILSITGRLAVTVSLFSLKRKMLKMILRLVFTCDIYYTHKHKFPGDSSGKHVQVYHKYANCSYYAEITTTYTVSARLSSFRRTNLLQVGFSHASIFATVISNEDSIFKVIIVFILQYYAWSQLQACVAVQSPHSLSFRYDISEDQPFLQHCMTSSITSHNMTSQKVSLKIDFISS